MPKRRHSGSEDHIKKKIRRLERKLSRRRRRHHHSASSASSENDSPPSRRAPADIAYDAERAAPLPTEDASRPASPSSDAPDLEVCADNPPQPPDELDDTPAAAAVIIGDNSPTRQALQGVTCGKSADGEGEGSVLNDTILNILGEDPTVEQHGPTLHKDIVSRWKHILTNGLKRESKQELSKLYLIPKNCTTLDAPELNAEIKFSMAEAAIKRDKAIENKQKQIGIALSCIGMSFNKLITASPDPELLKLICDAGRLLCDVHHTDSLTRRNYIIAGLNKDTKDAIQNSKIDKLLFGEDLSEGLKASKAIAKSGKDLRPQSSKQPKIQNKRPFASRPKNFKSPTLQQNRNHFPLQQYSGNRQHQQPRRTTNKPATPRTYHQSNRGRR